MWILHRQMRIKAQLRRGISAEAREDILVQAFLTCPNISEISKKTKIPRPTIYTVIHTDSFQRKYSEARNEAVTGAIAYLQMWVETRKAGKLTRKAETDTIQKLVEYAKGQGSSHAEMLYMTYSRLANKMAGINKRDEATVMQLNNLSLMENIILHEVDLGIMKGKHYKEIYKDCKERLETVKDLAYLEAV